MTILRKYSFSAVLSVIVLGIAFYYRHEMATALSSIDIVWVIGGFICILINYLFRAVRLNVLTSRSLSVWPAGLYCTSLHGFASYILPLRSGDLSLPFLLKATIHIDLKSGAVVLYKARLLEVFSLGICIFVTALIPSPTLPKSIKVTMFFLGVLMIFAPLLFRKLLGNKKFPFGRFKSFSKDLASNSKITFKEFLLTLGIWGSIAISIGCIAKAMELHMSVVEMALLIVLQLAMQLFPVQGFANSGNHESSWVAALMMMGHPGDLALQFAITSHIIILVYVIILGLIALAIRTQIFKKQ